MKTCILDDKILTSFTDPAHDVCKNILKLWHLRTNGTQSDSDRMRLALGEEAFGHYDWDTAVTNGRILLLIPRYKHPAGIKPPFGFHFPADWFWCFDQIEKQEDIQIAEADLIQTVAADLRAQIATLPNVEWIYIHRVNYFEHVGGKAKPKHRPPPAGIMFFRFEGGLGVALANNKL